RRQAETRSAPAASDSPAPRREAQCAQWRIPPRPQPEQSESFVTSRLLRLDAGFLGHLGGKRTVAGDEFDELVARADRGLDRTLDEIALPPLGPAGDPRDLVVHPVDDRQRRAGRREQA